MMALRTNAMLILMFVLAAACVVSALTIVHNQYQVRELISDIERIQDENRRLQDETKELSVEFSKVTLPKYVAYKATEMGLIYNTGNQTVILEPKQLPRFVTKSSKSKGEQQ